MFPDSVCRRDAGLTGLLDEITNSSEEGVWFIAECSECSSVFDVEACCHVSNEMYGCVCVFHSTQVADVELRMCFGSSAMDVFISLFSVSTSDGGQCFVKDSDINWTLLVCSLDIYSFKSVLLHVMKWYLLATYRNCA